MFTEETARTLSDDDLTEQIKLLTRVRSDRNDNTILANVRRAVAAADAENDEDYDDGDPRPVPVVIIFDTMEFENGHFLSAFPHVLYDDGTEVGIETDRDTDSLISREYGAVGPEASLAIRLHDGETEFDTYGDTVWDLAREWVKAYAKAHPRVSLVKAA